MLAWVIERLCINGNGIMMDNIYPKGKHEVFLGICWKQHTFETRWVSVGIKQQPPWPGEAGNGKSNICRTCFLVKTLSFQLSMLAKWRIIDSKMDGFQHLNRSAQIDNDTIFRSLISKHAPSCAPWDANFRPRLTRHLTAWHLRSNRSAAKRFRERPQEGQEKAPHWSAGRQENSSAIFHPGAGNSKTRVYCISGIHIPWRIHGAGFSMLT